MRVNFEEKTYENYFNIELSSKSNVIFPLGQVQEGFVGFDSSSYSKNRKLWRVFGYPFLFSPPFPGVDFHKIYDVLENELKIGINSLAKLKVNVLFQYKRPEYLVNSTAKEWSHWNQKYYRYDIYKEQHDLLIYLSDKFQKDVLILYASPAISNINDLIDAYRNKKIIELSNYKKATDLRSHKRNTYNVAGTYSLGFSEPTKIENINLLELFNAIKVEISNDDDNTNFIISFSNRITSLIKEYKPLRNEIIYLNEMYKDFSKYKLLYSFLTMNNFINLTGLQWLTIF